MKDMGTPGWVKFFSEKNSPPRRALSFHFRYFRAPTDVCGENGATLISYTPPGGAGGVSDLSGHGDFLAVKTGFGVKIFGAARRHFSRFRAFCKGFPPFRQHKTAKFFACGANHNQSIITSVTVAAELYPLSLADV